MALFKIEYYILQHIASRKKHNLELFILKFTIIMIIIIIGLKRIM